MNDHRPGQAGILAYGMVTPAAGGRADQVSALLAGRPLFRRHPRWVGPDGMRQVMSYVTEFRDNGSFPNRLGHLLQRAYSDCRAGQLVRFGQTYHAPMVLALPCVLRNTALFEEFRTVAAGLDFDGVTELHFVFGDRCGTMRALAQALELVDRNPQSLVHFAAVDSLVTPLMMDLRSAAGLSRSSLHPWSPIPSEGAICTLLGRADVASVAVLSHPSAAREPEAYLDPHRGLLGRGLRAAIEDQLRGGDRPQRVFSDAYAERWRAEELGVIQSELAGQLPDPGNWHVIAQAVGDLGAVSPLAAAVTAASLPGRSLILCSSRTGDRSALLVRGLHGRS